MAGLDRRAIAESIFKIVWDKLPGGGPDPRADFEDVKRFGQKLFFARRFSDEGDLRFQNTIWDLWIAKAAEANVELPYKSWEERFSGKYPSYMPEEVEIIYHQLLAGAKSENDPDLLFTGGPAGAGKSRWLQDNKGSRVLLDPDEGILENLGPYLFARSILKAEHEFKYRNISPAKTLETEITRRNRWREPPYNCFRGMSNAANTELAKLVVTNSYSAAFGFTGIDGYGLKVLLKQGFMAAGYFLNYAVVGADAETSKLLERKRERPASPTDFIGKRADFMMALPQYFEISDRIRFFVTEIDRAPLPVAEWKKTEGSIFCRSENFKKFIVSIEEEHARLVANPKTAGGAAPLEVLPAFLISHLEKPGDVKHISPGNGLDGVDPKL